MLQGDDQFAHFNLQLLDATGDLGAPEKHISLDSVSLDTLSKRVSLHGMKLHFTFATFGAGEAEHITGLSAVRQRDLRRHGILPSKGGGWQQHDLHDLARLLIIRALQDLGIGPSRGVEIANAAAPKIVILVLNRPGAIDDRTNGMLDQIKLDKSRGAFLLKADEPSGWLAIWGDRSMSFHGDLAADFRNVPDEVRMSVLALDLDLFASILAGRAGQSFVIVERSPQS